MRLIARFALDKLDNFEIIDVYDNKIERQSVDKKNPTVKSLMPKYPSAIWMERKIRDEFGIEFEGAFDNRPLVKHERFPKHIYPLRKDFNKKEIDFTVFTPYKYEEIEGDNVFVVPVGPIHAGIIEPGHFQFSQAGEEILHLEVRHYYKYRGIEKMVENKIPQEIKKIVERISGNESIAYQIAFMDILAQASESEIPNSLKQKYFTLLELERIIHHLTDLGFIPNDAGFGAALAFMSKLAEDARRVMAKITGHRFGFGAIKEEVEIDYQELTKFIDYLKKEVEFFEDWINVIASLWDRFNTTGALSRQKAVKYGVVGVAARASGIEIDVRNNLFYKNFGYKMQLGNKGEVSDRFRVRIKEVLNSIEMIKNFKTDKKEKLILNNFKDGEYMSFVESSIGELFMYMKIKEGIVDRFYVRDPSHINWQAFHTTIYKDIIADFPLINKSFDLSYAGNDL
ncbi:NADH-quinone oxidoreductase subunit C [Caminibacter pacificus]|uniref:Hydrogenase n=1 Tax=Caminibacter pacificus TaxID=1424653 RepID=A0AAJ4UXV4_9BACT|nr:NADH-quinone oxidoreductase subunit C [Caminibacter pacificus]QCI27916.1 hydrogenase [Caminibacter pacificus]ROR39906.1 Ni,Fe-hydrogenase III large subunit [Caminibacter pacificus]